MRRISARAAWLAGALAAVACGAPSALAPVSAASDETPAAASEVPVPAASDEAAPVEPTEIASAAASEPPPPTPPPGPRLGSVRHTTWIHDRASREARQIGYVREGSSVGLASTTPSSRVGCAGGWYAVLPRGFVCLDSTATLDVRSERFLALAAATPRPGEALPYRYAFSKGAPLYNRLPTAEEQLRVEGPREKRVEPPKLSMFLSGHEELATHDAIVATDQPPAGWSDGKPPGAPTTLVRKWIPHGSMLAYSHAFEANGRVWLLSPDLTITPADRMRPFRRSSFRGVSLGPEASLPLAWSRHDPAVRYRQEGEAMVATAEPWSPRTLIALTGERVERGGRVFWATRETGVYALDTEVTVARAREHDKMPASLTPKQRWLDVHLRAGTLVAYEGEQPVFATLVSPGAGGPGSASTSNEELVKRSATPVGVYRITWKTRAAMMTPETDDPKKFWIADVPHTQYFRPPFAIHTAYWHEDFGMPKSAGCINVSPEDGRLLYDWTDPVTPPDWQGAGPGKGMDVGTLLVIAP